MAKKMLIDAAHPEETRVVVLDGHRVDDFDFETQNKRQLRGNIYLAKVTRVEPSLQAAFVEYGGNRHGFLAFGEIHPDYYSIPVADREALKAEFAGLAEDAEPAIAGAEGESEAEVDDEEEHQVLEERRRRILTRRYKIQEVIKRRQIMLVQVVKEERGNKGAALTTYLSLAGRYCVLMPNTGRGGGISRKITNAADRKRLKKVATDLDVPHGMGLIVRTAGAKRTKTEIKRDYEYLIRAWETIRDNTMRSVAPALIYEESSLVKRAIRDLYDKDVDDIHVEGEAAYKEAKDFVRMLMPSHAKKVQAYKDPTPIFARHGVERQLESIYSPTVTLKSGGYIVINQTEALVSIDVNSGKATRERNIEQTALKTNLEAADEAARQMRLRDLAGLVVIDFIDMEEAKNDRIVEKKMKDCLRFDRARVQMGKISAFGLLELSRQRRRTGVLEGSSHVCPHCAGLGRVRSTESSALKLLRALDEECVKRAANELLVRAPLEVAIYVLNEKRSALAAIEDNRSVRIRIVGSPTLMAPDFEISSAHQREADEDEVERSERPERAERQERPERGDRRDRGRGDGRRGPAPAALAFSAPAEIEEADEELDEQEVEEGPETTEEAGADGDSRRRRRRGRRGGRRRREDGAEAPAAPAERPNGRAAASEDDEKLDAGGDRGRGRRRRRRGRGRRPFEYDGGEYLDHVATDPVILSALLGAPAAVADLDDEDEPEAPLEAEPARAAPEPVAAAPEPVVALVADADPEPEPDAEPVAESAPEEPYEPDFEKRKRFLARFSRWGKKA